MTEAEIKNENLSETAGVYSSDRKKYVSERGPFKIWENPPLTKPLSAEYMDTLSAEQAGAGFEVSGLAAKYGEEAARQKVGEMFKALATGSSTTYLFSQDAPGGMSLFHVWFGPNYPLFRHSHPAHGDCLYYVVAGEIRLGRRLLGPGSGFFVPNGQPYKYTAGPAGVEVLEFRAGGGEKGAPGMKFDEMSLEAVQKITDDALAVQDQWQQPEKIGDTAFRQQELELG